MILKRIILGCIAVLIGASGFSQVSFTSSNLPIIVVNTNGATIVDEPKTLCSLGIIYNGPGERNNITDPFNNYDGKAGLELRGSTSQGFPKKPYGVELWNDDGTDRQASLLGMPVEEDWILFAPYNDKSLVRDALAYRLSRAMGRYAPRAVFCELVINGQYQGIYVLMEKIKRDQSRVDISRLDPAEVTGEDLTGGYILKIDKSTGNGGSGFFSPYSPPNAQNNQRIFFQYDYPEPESIVPAQTSYIQQYVGAFETALRAANFDDPADGYRRYADVGSFVDFMILNEVSKNVDGYRLSTYLHKPKSGKLVMGPIWDFNLGFGNANYCTNGNPQGFVYNFNNACPGDGWLVPFWWSRLLTDEYFRIELGKRWKELRSGPLATSFIHAYIDSAANVLNQEARARNFQRWNVLGQYVWPNSFVGQTYQQEIDWLKNWVTVRMNWLDNEWAGLVTGLDKEQVRISLDPNPATYTLGVEFVSGSSPPASLTFTDLAGKPVRTYILDPLSGGDNRITLNLDGISAGVYLVRVDGRGWSTVKRIVVTR